MNPLQELKSQIEMTQGKLSQIAELLSQTENKGTDVGRRIFSVTTGWWPCTISTELEVKLLKEAPLDCLKVNFDPADGVKIERNAIAQVKSATRIKFGSGESQYECMVITRDSEKIRFICIDSEMIRKLFVLLEQPKTCQLFSLRERRIAYVKDYQERTNIPLVSQMREKLLKEFNIDLQFEPKGAKPPYPLFFISQVRVRVLDNVTIAGCSREINHRSGGNGIWLVDYYKHYQVSTDSMTFPQSGLFMNDPGRRMRAVLAIPHGDYDSYQPADLNKLVDEVERLVDLAYRKGEG
jgi:hypothetical protein